MLFFKLDEGCLIYKAHLFSTGSLYLEAENNLVKSLSTKATVYCNESSAETYRLVKIVLLLHEV